MNDGRDGGVVGSILHVGNVNKRFGGVHALDDVSLDVAPGTIHGLIGPNGAGKSTLLNVIGGQLRCDSGEISLAGDGILGRRPERIAAMGVRRTFQSATPLRGMSVLQNVIAGLHLAGASGPMAWRDSLRTGPARARAMELLRAYDLVALADQPAETLSFGHMRMLELARTVAAAPRLVLLDEPAAGLGDADVEQLRQRLENLRQTSTSILIVDHDVGFIVSLCDQLTVLDFGKVIGRGTPEEILRSETVRRAYLGEWAASHG